MRRILIIIGLIVLFFIIMGHMYFEGIWIPNFPHRNDFPVRGIDVSHHQGVIDWEKVQRDGIHFAYIKATEGGDWKDRRFQQNWASASKVGLEKGAYHFFTLRTSGDRQAKNFIKTVPREPGVLPPAVDLEFGGNSKARPGVDVFRKELAVFLEKLNQTYDTAPVLYTTYTFYSNYLSGMRIERLWIRDVVTRPTGFARNRWIFWQFSGRGNVRGIQGNVDLNVFHKNHDAFKALMTER